ncbi:hypothetical protein QQX98_009211 [Neonectria punicea]|uniref:Uncharacterized protein n=1 Tax=Neonectria punicea TaxID=979145 RepID=A0ABR1GTD5_9HYPO
MLGRHIALYINAWDEYDKDQTEEMMYACRCLVNEAARSGTRLQVCLASRPWTELCADDTVYLNLYEQAAHQSDIRKYLDAKLKIGRTRLSGQVQEQVLDKAGGVFLWVKLVVDMLNEDHKKGCLHRYKKWLKSSHQGLKGLYHEMLTRGGEDEEGEDRDARLFYFQWLLSGTGHAYRPKILWWGV